MSGDGVPPTGGPRSPFIFSVLQSVQGYPTLSSVCDLLRGGGGVLLIQVTDLGADFTERKNHAQARLLAVSSQAISFLGLHESDRDVIPKGLFLPRGRPSRGLTGRGVWLTFPPARGASLGAALRLDGAGARSALALRESWAFLTKMRGRCLLPGLPWGSRKTKVAMPGPPVSPTPSSCVRDETSAREGGKPTPRPGDTPLSPHPRMGPGRLGIDEPLELVCGALTSAPHPSQTSPQPQPRSA